MLEKEWRLAAVISSLPGEVQPGYCEVEFSLLQQSAGRFFSSLLQGGVFLEG